MALVDQGLSSGSNQIISIALARGMSLKEYGGFTLAFAILMGVIPLYYSFVVEPMMVFGSGKYHTEFIQYLRIVCRWQWALTVSVAGLLGLMSLLAKWSNSDTLAHALAGLAIALPFVLFVLLLRPACYVTQQLHFAVLADILNIVVASSGLLPLFRSGGLSTATAFLMLGLGAIAGGAVIYVSLLSGPSEQTVQLDIREIARDHYSFGGLNAIATATYLASAQIVPLILVPFWIGFKAEAALGAITNLFGPLNLLMRSVSMQMLPAVSKLWNQTHDIGRIKQYIGVTALLCACGVAAYSGTILALSRPILHYLYADRYHWCGLLIAIYGLTYIASSLEHVGGVAIKALQRPRVLIAARREAWQQSWRHCWRFPFYSPDRLKV